MSDQLVDIQPGGESTQYESIREYTVTPAKQTGQLGGNSAHTTTQKPGVSYSSDDSELKEKEDRREDAEQARKLALGEATAGSSGYTDKGTVDHTFFLLKSVDENIRHLRLKPETGGDAEAANRREQGYGPGSGVGA
ncbi:uncharacterized protein KD926_004928 [Aspergillus affinis]|uniref:uncharacterized protein n=1 Tax=Aspergillus affinis TaxID=1070780 RepID=UPI0022FEF8F0|nr:uncharacterized protein KD926_004928 [Aspergillus affinis]KAI9042862.1 hypothetical protein KD926_004928 [Aspergillus affinis]